MKNWARMAAVMLAGFVIGTGLWLWSYEPGLRSDSITVKTGVVTDRAMSGGIPYITVEFPDGTEICCWEIYKDNPIPEGLAIGQNVMLTYAVEEDQGRIVFLEAKQPE